MSIEERAEAWALDHTDILTQGWNQFQIGATKGYIAGATEERELHKQGESQIPENELLGIMVENDLYYKDADGCYYHEMTIESIQGVLKDLNNKGYKIVKAICKSGATEQQALSEARIKELEEALYIMVNTMRIQERYKLKNKILNNQQQ